MRGRAVALVAMALLAAAFAAPVAAGGATVERLTNIQTVLAVAMPDDFPVASLMRAECERLIRIERPDGSSTEILDCQLSDEPVMTPEFLQHQREVGNDLTTPRPEWQFPGLQPGDRWCVVAGRWLQSFEAGVAAPVVLAATNARALEVIPIELLQESSIDVPPDASSLA